MNMKLTTGVCIAALVLAACLYTPRAQATPSSITDPTNGCTVLFDQGTGFATEIDNLQIGQGSWYDVHFSATQNFDVTAITASSDYAPPDGITGAADAATIIADTLNYAAVWTVVNATDYTVNIWTGTVPSYSAQFYDATNPPQQSASGTDWITDTYYPHYGLETTSAIATFTSACQANAPEPPTLLLVGLGLICFIGLRRKYKGQIHIA